MLRASLARRWAAIATAAVGALVLTGCMLSAGKFTAALDLRRDNSFSYSYLGEVYILGLSKLAEMERANRTPAEFIPSLCYTERGEEPSERDCTKDELDQQRADWDEQQKKLVGYKRLREVRRERNAAAEKAAQAEAEQADAAASMSQQGM